jgi:polyribonucleotide nucleotidyltransferase
MNIHSVSKTVAGRTLTLETGRYAHQADGAVTIQYGDTVVLCTASMSEKGDPSADFFRLTMEYQERYYAAGKIKGSRFIKRDGRSSEEGILKARLMDRPMRPLFPKGITNEVQGIATVFSVDMENEPGVLALIGMSAAMMVAGLPFEGPLSGVRIGLVNGELTVMPTLQQAAEGDLDLVVAGTEGAITMVEAGSNEVDEETYLKALELAHSVIKEICALQKELVAKVQPEQRTCDVNTPTTEALDAVKAVVTKADLDTVRGVLKKEVKVQVKALKAKVLEQFAAQIEAGTYTEGQIKEALEKLIDQNMRLNILTTGDRVDFRKPDDIRPVSCGVGVLPRTHGTGLFQRGETQVLSVTTLGGPGDAQTVDTMDLDEVRRYIHHYNFPPYSVGEIRMLRGASRREIGHGALAERALIPVLPDKADFPYTIMVVSETLTCNGSSSMGSVCGSTLSLMDAGVPIKKPVAGIAMGLVCSDEFKKTGSGAYTILSDIQGLEDFAGDMDFKVTGTRDGITALQMDIKVTGITIQMMREAMEKAKKGREFILVKMLEAIAAPRAQLSKYAPMIMTMKINPDLIKVVIGKGGETIQKITAECGVEIDIEQDGIVTITAPNQEDGQKAMDWIKALTYEPTIGDDFDGEVVSIMDFGAFVEFAPGKDGLVHISSLRPYRVEKVSDVVKMGDKVKVRLIKVDEKGRYNLSMKEFYSASPQPQEGAAPAQSAPAAPEMDGGF